MIADRYYFSRLSEKEKQLYSAFYKGVTALEKEIFVSGAFTQNAVHSVYHALTLDNPHLYYLNQSYMNYTVSAFGVKIFPQYFCSKEQIVEYNRRTEKCVNDIISSLNILYDSESVKVKKIHDYIVTHISYDDEALHVSKVDRLVAAHSITGFFGKQRAVCEGIAKAAKLLLNAVDIKCICVAGKASHESDGNHEWNIVKINGKPYHMDFTWDLLRTQAEHIGYDYYALPDEAIRLDHSDFNNVPVCLSWDENYFVKNQLIFSCSRQMKDYISQKIAKGDRVIYFRMQPEAGKSMEEVMSEATKYTLKHLSRDVVAWRVATSYNQEQRTGRLILIPRL
ncbi:MAG: hypothetical protein E7195_01530 [Peptococcaceae bacterium]|nr:hypothetical protein [Peptococcaceae bacterium]